MANLVDVGENEGWAAEAQSVTCDVGRSSIETPWKGLSYQYTANQIRRSRSLNNWFLPASSHGQVGIVDISLQLVWGSMNLVR